MTVTYLAAKTTQDKVKQKKALAEAGVSQEGFLQEVRLRLGPVRSGDLKV